MEEYDVCVIGAGFGGAPVAALLAKNGLRVALVEKTARAGGKTQTTERKGYRFEMFGAVGIPAYNSRFHELVEIDLEQIGRVIQVLFQETQAAKALRVVVKQLQDGLVADRVGMALQQVADDTEGAVGMVLDIPDQ